MHVGWTGVRFTKRTDFSLLHSFETTSEGHGTYRRMDEGDKTAGA